MCGVAGFINKSGKFVDKAIAQKMARTIKHRGPDDCGFFVHNNVALCSRRLSIIDVAGGKQPQTNEDKSVQVILNGEIYSYNGLRDQLVKKGHRFKTRSDTEVIAHLYEEEGEKVFSKLKGQFAIAIWDVLRKTLILARDRMGEKPLYYSHTSNLFIFASEPKAILAHPDFKKELDISALKAYLAFEYVPAPLSMFKNIYKLKPGHYLIFKNNKLTIKKYWEVKFRENNSSEKDNLKEFEYKLEHAVASQLIGDVPVGIFLSGGIDSSTVAYFAQKNSNVRLNSFSIGFKEASFDESRYSHQVAKYLGLIHHHQIFSEEDLGESISNIAEKLDEPFADASILPTYLLTKFTRRYVKVALGGDGGDELLMGYPTYLAHIFADFYKKIPRGLHEKVIAPLINNLPLSHSNFSLDFVLKRFIDGVYKNALVRNQRWLGSFTTPLLRREILSTSMEESGDPLSETIKMYKLSDKNNWHKLIYLYLKTYLEGDILVKTDRASMFNSLEVRAPFLDYELVDFINSLPLNLKLRGFTAKYILKQLMRDKLPKEIVNRKKHGFGIPLASWMRNNLKDFLLHTLSESKIRKEGIFNEKKVTKLVREHLDGRKDNHKQLWTLVMFELWREHWL